MGIIKLLLIYLFYILHSYFYFMIAVVILSWVPGIREYKWFRTCEKISDFYLGRFRGLIVIGYLDLTPILGFFIYQMALRGIVLLVNYINYGI